ncbi:hypothetical protein HYV81_00710 [Candidatus Woesearchaeota archaeon]|nr:hypothetical protein [Candidatus Woesearchaeota archaeon]
MSKSKAQVSIEFMFAIGVILFIFVLLSIVTLERKGEIAFASNLHEAQADCSMLANLIDAVYTSRDANVSVKLRNNATVIAGNRFIEVEKNSQTIAFCTFTSTAVSNGSDSTFKLVRGNVSIRNENNSITLQNA